MIIQPLTEETILKFYGEQLPFTVRGVSVSDGENILGVSGLAYDVDGAEFFMDMRDGLPAMTIWRAAKQVVALIRSWGVPARACPSSTYPNAEAFLERLGFTPNGTRHNKTCYRL